MSVKACSIEHPADTAEGKSNVQCAQVDHSGYKCANSLLLLSSASLTTSFMVYLR